MPWARWAYRSVTSLQTTNNGLKRRFVGTFHERRSVVERGVGCMGCRRWGYDGNTPMSSCAMRWKVCTNIHTLLLLSFNTPSQSLEPRWLLYLHLNLHQ